MAIAKVDDIIAALAAGNGKRSFFNKIFPSTTVAGIPHTAWLATGIPGAGTTTATGKANGTACTSATAGALDFVNAAGGTTEYLVGVEAAPLAATGVGTIILYDRLCHVNIAHSEATGAVTGMGATTRLALGEGGFLFTEVTSALSAASNTFNFTYTNQAGVGSRTTPNVATVASAVVGRSATASLIIPLQAGDGGIRSLDSLTLVSGSATGNINLVIGRLLAALPLTTAGVCIGRDTVMELMQLPKLYDASCLSFLFIPNAAGTPTFVGSTQSVWG
jgi:hypothetical protein